MDDNVEGSWDRQLTGREVGVWCVDLIEEIGNSPDELTDKARALLGRLASLNEPEKVFKQLAEATLGITADLRFYIGTNQFSAFPTVDPDEAYKRAILSTRASMRGEARDPLTPASDG